MKMKKALRSVLGEGVYGPLHEAFTSGFVTRNFSSRAKFFIFHPQERKQEGTEHKQQENRPSFDAKIPH